MRQLIGTGGGVNLLSNSSLGGGVVDVSVIVVCLQGGL